MFEENENSYPVKPELLIGNQKKNRLNLFVFALTFLLFLSNYLTEMYIVLGEILLVLIIHELGHYLMMRYLGVKAQGMFFMAFLGKMNKTFRFSNSQRQQTLINLMGPIPGILIGCGLFLWASYSEPNLFIIELSILLIGINLLNLLPIDPFDGGRVVGGFFFNQNDSLKMAFSLVSSILIIISGVYFDFWPLIIFGFLMGLKVRSYQKTRELHYQLEEENINYKKEYKDLTDKEYWKIRSVFLRKNPKLSEMIPSGNTLWENERLLVEQVRQLLRINLKPDISILGKILIVFFMLTAIITPILMVYSNYDIIDWYLENANI